MPGAQRVGHAPSRSTRRRRGRPDRATASDGARCCSSRRPRSASALLVSGGVLARAYFRTSRIAGRLRAVGRPDRATAAAAIALCERSRTGRGDGTHPRSHRRDPRRDPLRRDDEPLHAGLRLPDARRDRESADARRLRPHRAIPPRQRQLFRDDADSRSQRPRVRAKRFAVDAAGGA